MCREPVGPHVGAVTVSESLMVVPSGWNLISALAGLLLDRTRHNKAHKIRDRPALPLRGSLNLGPQIGIDRDRKLLAALLFAMRSTSSNHLTRWCM